VRSPPGCTIACSVWAVDQFEIAITVMVWVGTITFAASGALAAVAKRFDLIGVMVLGGVTAVGGGSIRDIMVGDIPPPALRDEALLWAIAVTVLVVFLSHRWMREGRVLYLLDTASLALFAALGAERGIAVGLGFWGTVFTGAVSGVGGGMIRDVLSGEVPRVLYRSGDLYASAAALGAATVFLLWPLVELPALVAGVAVAAAARVGSRLLGLSVPTPRADT
jgi:uncharacterized membrane protein YeiH